MLYDHRYTATYLDCVRRYEHRPEVCEALRRALQELAVQPFGNPTLQTHAVKRAQPDTFTSYVGNQGHRLIWRRVGNVIILLLFGEHDAVYRRAERLRLEIDDSQNVLRVIDEDPVTERPVAYVQRRQAEGRLFMAWNDRALAECGFEEQEIPVLRRLDTDAELLALEHVMRPVAWERAMNLAMYAHPDGAEAASRASATSDSEADLAEPDPPAAEIDPDLTAALADRERSVELVPVAADELAELLARPIEDWMVYLDPSQDSLVARSWSGPARIRGAAGTGKTVVALHRARWLARAGRRVLFTTYVRSLPEIYQEVFCRFAPAERGGVEFANVHRWAAGFLHRNNVHLTVDVRSVDAVFKRACDEVLAAEGPLRRAGLTRSYLRQELDWLIKGRALADRDAYLALERNGRGTPLSRELREAVWQLYERYQAGLAERQLADFNDLLITAYEVVQQLDSRPVYDAVIVDESQDLTENAVRLLAALVDQTRPDCLLLVGDGQQSIYPGGFHLASVGVEVRGRSHVLIRNYRNTEEVYRLAAAVVAGRPFDDGGERLETVRGEVELARRGPAPVTMAAIDLEEHDLALAVAIQDAVTAGTGPGDVAVLVPTNAQVGHYAEQISGLGLPTQLLADYDGVPNQLVKVGTYQRAKGLEFKQVFLPRLDADGLREERRRGEDQASYAERLDLLRRQLFVAMTRARDALWLGWVAEPSSILPAGVAHG
jgi:hypothetical protein